MKLMKAGDKVYYNRNGQPAEAEIIRISGDYVTLRYFVTVWIGNDNPYFNMHGGFRLRKNRVYSNKKEAEEAILEQRQRKYKREDGI